MKKILLSTLLLLYLSSSIVFGQAATVNLNQTAQLIRGFGGMNHPVWIGDLTPAQRTTAFNNGPNDLGFTILRIWISDNPTQWSRELETARRTIELGGIVFASPWNPPSHMVETFTRGNQTDAKRLRYDMYGAYTQHLNDFVAYMRDNGVDLYAISVQNEPDYAHDWTWWTNAEMIRFMRDFAGNINCRVIAPESFQYTKSVSDPILNDPQALANMDILGAHLYGTQYNNFAYPLFKEKGAGKELWMTEVYHPNSESNSADRWPEALETGRNIHHAMADGEFQNYIWWYIRRQYSPMKEDGTISKRGYMMCHYSKFVRPGYYRVEATKQPANNVLLSAYKDGNDVVIVVLNRNTGTSTINISVPGTQVTSWERYVTSGSKNLVKEANINAGASFQVTLDGESMTTFVGKAQAAPTVTLTAPQNNAVFVAPASVTLSASASTPQGSVVKIDFYLNNERIVEKYIAPYNWDVTDLPTGNYTVRAVAFDNQGNTTEDEITFRVNVPQTPYSGSPHPIPGTIQAEEFDHGGNGFAYFDDTPGSQTDVEFRTDEDVDIENCTDTGGGYNIGWTTAGEWLEYTVDVTQGGFYELDLRIACNGDDRTISVSMDGSDIATDIEIPNTTGWQVWQTVTVRGIELQPGQKIMRISIGDVDYVNINFVAFNLVEAFVRAPYNGAPHLIPGRIQAQEFDFGGQGIGYNEANNNGNEGGADIRNGEVDIEVTQDVDGEYNVGYILTGEWLAYTVEVASTGLYTLDARMATVGDGKFFHIEINDEDVSGPIAVPNTEGWQVWETISVDNIPLTAGEHVMKIVFDSDFMNLNWVEFRSLITEIENKSEIAELNVFPNPTQSLIQWSKTENWLLMDAQGQELSHGKGQKIDLQTYPSGLYFLKIANNIVKVIKE